MTTVYNRLSQLLGNSGYYLGGLDSVEVASPVRRGERNGTRPLRVSDALERPRPRRDPTPQLTKHTKAQRCTFEHGPTEEKAEIPLVEATIGGGARRRGRRSGRREKGVEPNFGIERARPGALEANPVGRTLEGSSDGDGSVEVQGALVFGD